MHSPRTIGILTTSRADYGMYRPLLRAIAADPALRLALFVTGMHLAPEYGSTVSLIEEDGYPIAERVEMLLSSDTPQGLAISMGLGTIGFAHAYARTRPDVLVVLGDRFETHAAAIAALPFAFPLAHIHGGELTLGAIDDALRHAITHLSHLHFVSTHDYARRVMQLGVEPWRVHVCGAPSLDNLHDITLLSRDELSERIGWSVPERFLLVTYHPVTLEYEQADWQVGELLRALATTSLPVLFTLSNADTSGRRMNAQIERFVAQHPDCYRVGTLGTQGYFSAMSLATAMVGNSSSGIIEAASFRLPVVNIGHRQRGRFHSYNVLDTSYDCDDIVHAIRHASSPAFRASLTDLVNPYGDGHASQRIVQVLRDTPLDGRLRWKEFCDWDKREEL